jgi:hypothetical protein
MENLFSKGLKWNPLALLAIATAIFASWIAIRYARQPILESYGFRQTQTALTSFWMMREGWQLNYQTPVAGYPWSIPFEFPIYQAIVALIAYLGSFQLDPVGRLLSFCFLLACAWPALKITKILVLPTNVFWIFCTLLWSSPLYLFWGRSFMIETAALFFTLSAIPYALEIRETIPDWRSVLLFAFWATLGMLQKVTTAAPVTMIMGIVVAMVHIEKFGYRFPSWKKIARIFVAFTLPIFIAGVWAHYTDVIKEQNLFGAYLTSKTLTQWNFGTLQQRLDLNVLKTIFWDRIFVQNAAGIFGIAILTSALIWGERRMKSIVMVGLCLFILPIFIFINLHFIHTYYQVSSTLFLIGAIAVAVVSLTTIIKRPLLAPALTTILVVANLFSFYYGYAQSIRMKFGVSNSQILAVSDVIRRYTPENSGIIVFGTDWSSEVPYYAQRKSFAVPAWIKVYDRIWANPAEFIGDLELGAIVYCTNGENHSLNKILARPDVILQPKLFKVMNCYLWMPEVDSIVLPGKNRPVLPISNLGNLVDSSSIKNYTFKPPSGCEGSIDLINYKSPAAQKEQISGSLNIDGWLAVSAKDGVVPDDVYITLQSSEGTKKYAKPERVARKDVNKYFKQPNMAKIGFTISINVADLNGEYTLGLARGYKGDLVQCLQFNIPLNFKAIKK